MTNKNGFDMKTSVHLQWLRPLGKFRFHLLLPLLFCLSVTEWAIDPATPLAVPRFLITRLSTPFTFVCLNSPLVWTFCRLRGHRLWSCQEHCRLWSCQEHGRLWTGQDHGLWGRLWSCQDDGLWGSVWWSWEYKLGIY